MNVLTGLAPERVFYYFEEISRIPGTSFNTKKINDYLMKFAEEHHLTSVQDAANNVIIFKDGSVGYERSAPVILHGHSGITAAMILAVLEDDTISHPPIEAVITADGEVGMSGAEKLDYSRLTGRRMLNLGSSEENIYLAGCAGGMRCSFDFGVRWDEVSADWMEISVQGLLGGNSDNEIDKNRANADILLGRIMYTLGEQIDYSLSELEGGIGDNEIPHSARMVIGIDSADKAQVLDVLGEIDRQLKQEYRGSDDGISVGLQELGEQAMPALNPRDLQRITFFLMNLPNGISKMSGVIPSLVETSCNLGVLKLDPYGFHGVSCVRSFVRSAGKALSDKICYLTEFLGGIFTIEGVYPAWECLSESPFRAHTTKETLSVSSTERFYRFVLEALKSMEE